MMNQPLRIARALICLSSISLLCIQAAPPRSLSSGEKLAARVAKSHLKSFPQGRKDSDLLEQAPGMSSAKKKKKKVYEVMPKALPVLTAHSVSLKTVLAHSTGYQAYARGTKDLLNDYSWEDLRLLWGTSKAPGAHLLGCIDRTQTAIGHSVLASWLVTPTASISTLKHRQHIVRQLRGPHGEVLQQHIATLRALEDNLLSLWTATDPLYGEVFSSYLNDSFYLSSAVNNNSVVRLEFNKRFWRDFMGIQLPVLYPFIIRGLDVWLSTSRERGVVERELGPHGRVKLLASRLWGKLFIPGYNYFAVTSYNKKVEELLGKNGAEAYRFHGALTWGTLIGSTLVHGWKCYSAWRNYGKQSRTLQALALRIADVQDLLRVAQHVSQYVAKYPTLEKRYGQYLTGTRDILARAENTHSEIGRMIYYLFHLPLRQRNYFFHNTGKMLVAYKLLLAHKDVLIEILYELGQLDAFLSVAKLMNLAEKQNPKQAYAFATYLPYAQRKTPYLAIKGMWNPFIDAKVAVPNDLVMGAEAGETRNIILTGPNAGGKSTFLTGATTAILLGQTLGIAPARSARFTPFSRINTYINIVDDVAAGKSLFMAEVDRANKYLQGLKVLKKHEFSWSIMDELFSGTNPIEGEAAAYSILEYVSTYRNALTIAATHFPRVMLLEDKAKRGGFQNYKVYIGVKRQKNKKSKILYHYKVVPGRSNQAIAIDILTEQGYDTSILKWAHDMINHPEKYPAKFK